MSFATREEHGEHELSRRTPRELVCGYTRRYRPAGLCMFTLPCCNWTFEHMYLRYYDEHACFVGTEYEAVTYYEALHNMPSKAKLFSLEVGDLGRLYHLVHDHPRADAHLISPEVTYPKCNAGWLDLCCQLCFPLRHTLSGLSSILNEKATGIPLAITILAGREPKCYSAVRGPFGKAFHVLPKRHRACVLEEEAREYMPNMPWAAEYYFPFCSHKGPMLLVLGRVYPGMSNVPIGQVRSLTPHELRRLCSEGRRPAVPQVLEHYRTAR